jgi:hypothetical protein
VSRGPAYWIALASQEIKPGEISGDQIMPTIERVLRRLAYDV